MTNRPSTLASFAYTWVGGDIHGLSAFSGTLYGYLSRIDDIVTAVNSRVSGLVSDAGWTGDAASSFSQAWEADARGAVTLGAAIQVIGDTVDSLAVRLAELEHELETAADQAAAAGVTVNPDGTASFIAPTAGHGMLALTPAMAAVQSSTAAFGQLRDRVLADAQQARVDAATTLENLFQQLSPDGPRGAAGSAAAGVADQLAGFWSLATPFNVKVARNARHLSWQGNVAEAAWVGDGGAVAEYSNAGWTDAGGTAGSRLASAPSITGAVATVAAAGQSDQPWYEGISDESLAGVTTVTMSGDVGESAGGELSFVSPPMAGARVGAATGGVLSAGIGSAAGTLLDGDEGAGEDVGQSATNAKRLWNRTVKPAR
jgi:uncharacterized protein YukE